MCCKLKDQFLTVPINAKKNKRSRGCDTNSPELCSLRCLMARSRRELVFFCFITNIKNLSYKLFACEFTDCCELVNFE